MFSKHKIGEFIKKDDRETSKKTNKGDLNVNVKSEEYIKEQIFSALNFYYPKCMDLENGGYVGEMLDDGTIVDVKTKHLVATSRHIYTFSVGALLDGPEWCKEAAEHGLRFLQSFHLDKENGGYFTELSGQEVADSSKNAYGHAFVLLAASMAAKAGISGSEKVIEDVYQTMEKHFWEEEHRLYRDFANADWSNFSSYRGQNANMHSCEAMLTAYEATGDEKYLKRAHELAESVVNKLASQSGGWIWEHFDEQWKANFQYSNETNNETRDEFRPIGFVPGHQFEWCKMFVWLDKYQNEPGLVEKAETLFKDTWNKAWDEKYGGLIYSLTQQFEMIDDDKNYWVQAEAIAASAMLAARTGNEAYWDCYRQVFQYSHYYFIDHQYGAWYALLSRQNKKYSELKSPATKADYHPISACYLALREIK